MAKSRYLTAKDVTERLNISPATLYAYVSRGLIRSETGEGDPRTRRYRAEDVQKLEERKTYRQNPAKAAQESLHWGTPLLESALTLITDDRLYYRGYGALKLAAENTVEQVAALLWTGNMANAGVLFTAHLSAEPYLDALARLKIDLSLMQRLTIALTLAATDDLAAYDLRPDKAAQSGARLLRLMAAVLADNAAQAPTIVELLQAGWRTNDPKDAALLNAALILSADHELNVSSFAARVVASAETQPYLVVIAGLSALQGLLHGGNTERVEALLREVNEPQQARRIITERLRRGERIPGFGHKLYSGRDPRGHYLLDRTASSYPDAESVLLGKAIVDAVADTLELAPNIDFGLTVLARTLHLPPDAALALFALGRTIGWIGHAIEQYNGGGLIRPRASYVGDAPRGD